MFNYILDQVNTKGGHLEISQSKKQMVTIQSIGETPVFAVFDSKSEAFMALFNLNKDKITLHDN